MSIKLVSLVWDSEYAKFRRNTKGGWTKSHAKLLVMLKLADHASDDGDCYPSQLTIAKRCGVSERDVKRVIKELHKDGKITITKTKRVNVYKLNFLDLDANFQLVTQCHQSIGDMSDTENDLHVTSIGDTSVTPYIEPSEESPTNRPTRGARKAKERDPRVDHPAVKEFTALMSIYPPKERWDDIIAWFGTDFDRGRLKDFWLEWIDNGFSRVSTKWLRWYFKGVTDKGGTLITSHPLNVKYGFSKANGRAPVKNAPTIEDELGI